MTRLILKSAIFPDGQIELSPGDLPASIGRSQRADITINDLLLSRIHAEIRAGAHGGFELVDLDSTNLTIVNEHDIESVILKSGDRILLGESELIVEVDLGDVGLHDKTTREIPTARSPENNN